MTSWMSATTSEAESLTESSSSVDVDVGKWHDVKEEKKKNHISRFLSSAFFSMALATGLRLSDCWSICSGAHAEKKKNHISRFLSSAFLSMTAATGATRCCFCSICSGMHGKWHDVKEEKKKNHISRFLSS